VFQFSKLLTVLIQPNQLLQLERLSFVAPCLMLLSCYLFIISGSVAQRGLWSPRFTRFRDHTQLRATVGRTTHGRVISSSQRPLPDNTQHSQQTNFHASGGIRTHDRSRRGHWDRQVTQFLTAKYHCICSDKEFQCLSCSRAVKSQTVFTFFFSEHHGHLFR
jgi:hypothetical protein